MIAIEMVMHTQLQTTETDKSIQ